jgi:hypothetical protein
MRGVDYIDPVPLVSPDLVPPPPELAQLHFNDWVLAFVHYESICAQRTWWRLNPQSMVDTMRSWFASGE